MFWIGLIVGAFAWAAFTIVFTLKVTNMSYKEFEDSVGLLIEAGNNRESTLSVHYDDACQNVMTFEEK